MDESRDVLEKRLRRLEGERAQKIKLVENINDLLSKAEGRRREDPGKAWTWNRKLDNLEESLIEQRRLLSVCEQEIVRITNELDSDAAGDARAGEAVAFRVAAVRVLATPIGQVSTLSLQDVAMAKVHLESSLSGKPDAAELAALQKRVAALEKVGGARQAPGGRIQERRRQLVLRKAIDRATGGRMASLTMNEVKLMANYFELLTQGGERSKEDGRIHGVLEEVLGQVSEELSCLARVVKA